MIIILEPAYHEKISIALGFAMAMAWTMNGSHELEFKLKLTQERLCPNVLDTPRSVMMKVVILKSYERRISDPPSAR